jgi:hypothetical protein
MGYTAKRGEVSQGEDYREAEPLQAAAFGEKRGHIFRMVVLIGTVTEGRWRPTTHLL